MLSNPIPPFSKSIRNVGTNKEVVYYLTLTLSLKKL